MDEFQETNGLKPPVWLTAKMEEKATESGIKNSDSSKQQQGAEAGDYKLRASLGYLVRTSLRNGAGGGGWSISKQDITINAQKFRKKYIVNKFENLDEKFLEK